MQNLDRKNTRGITNFSTFNFYNKKTFKCVEFCGKFNEIILKFSDSGGPLVYYRLNADNTTTPILVGVTSWVSCRHL